MVLDYMGGSWPLQGISLKNLTLKLVMLIALVTGQRGQAIHMLKLSSMTVKYDSVEFIIEDKVKTSGPGRQQPLLVLPVYAPDINLCVAATLSQYVLNTAPLRSSGADKLFVSFIKPHSVVSRDTISRWIIAVMKLAGVDTRAYKAHSTRAASTSAAAKGNVPLDTILRTAGWTNATTFAKYYNKQIIDSNVYGNVVVASVDA